MAQKITVALEDDLDGGPADETVPLRFDGAAHEIDLSTKNARRFRTQLVPFIAHARTVGRPGAGQAASAHGGRPSAQRRHLAAATSSCWPNPAAWR